MRYVIHCEVDGGVTGHRSGYLKENGKLLEFESKEEAYKKMPECRTTERGVVYVYWIEPIQ